MILKEILKDVTRAAVGGHMRPDGDCVGSCMGLYLYLKQWYPNIQVDVYLEEIPDSFRFLTDSEIIKHKVDQAAKYDLFMALDCGDTRRLGFSNELFEQTAKTVCIDHHISNIGYADHNYIVSEASSTAELIYNLCEKEKINKAMAEYLYMGLVHDTGVFQYSATSPSTMEAAAELMRKGINASGIIERTYYEKTYEQNRILGHVLLNCRLYLKGRCIVSVLTTQDLDHYGVKPGELDGIASQMRNTKGVDASLFLYELTPGEFKGSLRSSDAVNVNEIARYFGGGGHKKAAGFSLSAEADMIIEQVLEQMVKQWNRG